MEKQIRILLDAGHYGYRNQSPLVPKYFEAIVMWKLQGYLKKALEHYSFFVGTTRTDQTKDLAVEKRGRLAADYDLFLSLHSNAVARSNGENVDRVSVYASYDNLNDSHVLAARLAAGIAEIMKVSAGYVKTRKSDNAEREYYGVLRGARAVGCPLFYIIEHSFHTNEYAAKWLLNDENLMRLAELEAAIIAEYYGVLTPYRAGDVDGDGKISALDYLMIKRAVLGTITLSEEQTAAADIDHDGRISYTDYILCKRAVLGTYTIK